MSDEAGLFLLKKLPACWRGLFDCSVKHNSSTILHRMNEWYQGQTSSQYGGILDWDDLIQSLVVEEPLCTDNSLVFVTRFSQLPTYLQQSFLSFLLHHRQSIPRRCLLSFTEVLEPSMQKDSWVGILHRMLVAYIKCKADESILFDGQYQFTSENSDNFESLRQRFGHNKTSYSPWNITPDSTAAEVIHTCDKEQGTSSNDDRVMSPDFIMIEDEDEPPIKVPKMEPLLYIEQSQIMSKTQSESQIEPEDLEKMKTLKDKWQNGDDTDIPDEMDVIMSPNTSLIRLCEEVNLADISEVAISKACIHVIRSGAMISHGNCTELLSALLLQKFKEMQQSASRILTGVVTMVAENLAKPLIEGVFVPATQGSLSTFQSDLMVKICKDVFNKTSRYYLLEQIFKYQPEITDNLIAVLQTILDNKLDIENSLLTVILESLKDQGIKLEKNLKFGKLILALITKYGGQMTMEHKEILSQILMTHKSFLKKTIQAAVTKL